MKARRCLFRCVLMGFLLHGHCKYGGIRHACMLTTIRFPGMKVWILAATVESSFRLLTSDWRDRIEQRSASVGTERRRTVLITSRYQTDKRGNIVSQSNGCVAINAYDTHRYVKKRTNPGRNHCTAQRLRQFLHPLEGLVIRVSMPVPQEEGC